MSAHIFTYILGIELSDSQWEAGVNKHAKTCVNKPIENLKAAFQDLQNQPDPDDKIEALEQMFTAAKEFKDRMEAIIQEANNA